MSTQGGLCLWLQLCDHQVIKKSIEGMESLSGKKNYVQKISTNKCNLRMLICNFVFPNILTVFKHSPNILTKCE